MINIFKYILLLLPMSLLFNGCEDCECPTQQCTNTVTIIREIVERNSTNGRNGRDGAPGPQGEAGDSAAWDSIPGNLIFTFTTVQNTNRIGTWRLFVISPDAQETSSPSIDVTAPSITYTVTVGTNILLSSYTMVIYNESITNSSGLLTGSIWVSNTVNSSVARYNYFTPPSNPGLCQELIYTPFE